MMIPCHGERCGERERETNRERERNREKEKERMKKSEKWVKKSSEGERGDMTEREIYRVTKSCSTWHNTAVTHTSWVTNLMSLLDALSNFFCSRSNLLLTEREILPQDEICKRGTERERSRQIEREMKR